MKIFDVVALGEAMIEFNQTEVDSPHYLQGFGGDTSNAVIAAARAGARCAYVTRVGKDLFGDQLLDLWRREGVDTGGVEVDVEHATGIYFVTHQADGHRFSYMRAGSAASRMAPQWVQTGAVKHILSSTHILHTSGISLAISTSANYAVMEAMRTARPAGALVAFDANLRLKLWSLARARVSIEQAVALSDIFLPSLDEAIALSGLSDPDAMLDWGHQLGARMVVLKLGADGALVSDGARRERIAGHRVPLVDATGAGDCFSGNLIARMAQGMDLFEAARYANAAAALSVQGFGAVAPLPRAATVQAMLSSTPSPTGRGQG
jgi:2-dehydro-3-deoxygluconokinase